MLGVDHQKTVAVPSWEAIDLRAQLPNGEKEYFSSDGAMPIKPDSRRVFNRKYMRARTVIQYDGLNLAGYLSDISRSGMGFYSPVQVFPCEPLVLILEGGAHVNLRAKTCVRVQEGCYRVGAIFVGS